MPDTGWDGRRPDAPATSPIVVSGSADSHRARRYRAPMPTNELEIDAILDAVFDSVRYVVSDIESNGAGDARGRNIELFDQLIKDHNEGAVVGTAMLLAEAAANGFLLAARGAGHPIATVLGSYEQQLREHADFSVIVAREFLDDEEE